MVPGTGGGRDCLTLVVATALTQLLWLPGENSTWPLDPTQGCCGSHIVGGHEVKPHARPYMASVNFEGHHHCGGFLFHAHWVLSAAHCFSDRDPSTGLVVLGAHALLTPEPTQQVFGIAAVVSHPDFEPTTQANDICLLRADSGGPLVCGNRAHGLVSFSGLWCGDPKTPDVYTQVSAFVSWIWDVVRASPTPGSMGCSLRAV
ncbi:serine protease 57 isoform X5 [Rattus norvegicus]|uniref:serine protease 57 isoform X5 n=1 Tax=Rattus norvegicus TaxID=10116 RepID=UPI0019174249|nr:serine protease 57 isoform X5 [Rattus norvegicus]